MQLIDAISQRRSIKHYDPSVKMTDKEFSQLMSATILSPTSYNIQHWRFVRVQDKALRRDIQQAAWDQSQVGDASELIILCGDINAWNDRPERYWADADANTQNMLLPMIESFYAGKEQLQRDEAIRSCSIAAQTLMLTAKSMGYDSNPMIGFDSDEVARLINLPQGHLIAMMIVVGKSTRAARPRGGQLPINELVIDNTFS
ncbi:MAG: nitroreductase family protein [Cellvibrionaceae bacterium]